MSIVGRSYFDGSGGSAEGRITLAGYSAPPTCWEEFEVAWEKVLAGDGSRPPCRYLHMTELHGKRGEYTGWTDTEAWTLQRDAMNTMGALAYRHSGRFFGTTCSINLGDYERARIDRSDVKWKTPEEICVDWVVPQTFHLLQPSPDDPTKGSGMIDLVFDRNEPFMHHVNKQWAQKRSKRPSLLRHVSSITTADMKEVRPLQSADFLAWLTNRDIAHGHLLHQAMRFFTVPLRERKFDYDGLIEEYGGEGAARPEVRK